MSAYLVITYDVSDPDRYADYNPGSLEGILATVAKHGGEAAFAGPPDVVTGTADQTAVGIKFPDAAAARAWLDDPEYAPYKAIRMEATAGTAEYVVPGLG